MFSRGTRVYYTAILFGGRERHYGRVVTGRSKTLREEGVGDPESHLLVQTEDSGMKIWIPVRKLKIAT